MLRDSCEGRPHKTQEGGNNKFIKRVLKRMNFLSMTWSPLDYASAAVISREASEELFSRLDWMSITPRVVVDMGCGTGEMSSRLQARYTDAIVIALDLSERMIQHAKHQTPTLSCVCGDAGALPLADQSVDLIFANQLVPWHADVKKLLHEWRRVLRPDGVVMLTALGPDTLKEWRELLHQAITPDLMDMHDIGDLMVHEKFADPVLDINHYTLTYRDQQQLFKELHASGILNSTPAQSLTNTLARTDKGTWSVTYEVVFAHAFVPPQSDEVSASSDGIVRIPLSRLRQRLRS